MVMSENRPGVSELFEIRFEHLRSLRSKEEARSQYSNRNEATTRLHLIDAILFDVLQWQKDSCRAEERLDGDDHYTDYSLWSAPKKLSHT